MHESHLKNPEAFEFHRSATYLEKFLTKKTDDSSKKILTLIQELKEDSSRSNQQKVDALQTELKVLDMKVSTITDKPDFANIRKWKRIGLFVGIGALIVTAATVAGSFKKK